MKVLWFVVNLYHIIYYFFNLMGRFLDSTGPLSSSKFPTLVTWCIYLEPVAGTPGGLPV